MSESECHSKQKSIETRWIESVCVCVRVRFGPQAKYNKVCVNCLSRGFAEQTKPKKGKGEFNRVALNGWFFRIFLFFFLSLKSLPNAKCWLIEISSSSNENRYQFMTKSLVFRSSSLRPHTHPIERYTAISLENFKFYRVDGNYLIYSLHRPLIGHGWFSIS